MRLRPFFRWVNSNLKGHIVYYGSVFTVAFSATSIYQNYTEQTLTLRWAIFIVVVCALMSVVCATIIWFFITSPRLKRDTSDDS